MDLLLLVMSAAALWIAFSARRRLSVLERDLATLREAVGPKDPAAPDAQADGSPWGSPRRNRAAQAADAPGSGAPADAEPDIPIPQTTPPRAPGAAKGALDRLTPWLRDNWIYPAAGVALVLSGVFLVQYAIETGRMTPVMQIGLAATLAAALVAGGEWLRRRPLAGPALPATLTGAGLVIAMATVLAALHIHDMIGPAMALILLAVLSFAAIALGWAYGPMLSALGIIAGTCVPFVLGGDGPPPPAIFGYFALLAFAGLGIDARRRWGWVTWLALAGPLTAIVLWRLAGGDDLAFALAVTLVAGAAMTLPFGYVQPLVTGPRALGRGQPAQGVRASFVATGVAAIGLAMLVPGMAGPVGLTALAVLVGVWCTRAPALADQMVWPVLAMSLWIMVQGWTGGPVIDAFSVPRLPESSMPLQVSLILGLALLGGLALIWRGEAEDPGRHAPFTLAGLVLPGGALVALETTWAPAATLGTYEWALHAMALAGAATLLALRYGQRDGGSGPRLGAAASAAFAALALGLMLMLSAAALTIALAVLMVTAAAMDRRFDIPGLGAFMILASLVLGWRLVLDPGLGWHLDTASTPAFLLSLVATLAGPLLALWVLQSMRDVKLRRYTRLVMETGLLASAAITAALVIARLLGDQIGPHAQLGLMASVLIALAWVQARRAALPFLRRLRIALAWIFAVFAGLALVAAAVYPASPVFGDWPFIGRVAGWPVLNDLILAYLLPAVLLGLMGRSIWVQRAGWGLGALWVGCMIRHLWQGADLRISNGIAQPELYAYTFALLLAGAATLAGALRTARPDLRKIGLSLTGLAAAKAFLIDAAALDGLLRVGAFLGLGLTLAGLAWLNGWAVARETRPKEPPTEA